MANETFVPLDYDYIDVGDSAAIRIWARTKSNKRVCIIDKTDAYFWIIPKPKVDIEKYAEKVKKISLNHAGRQAKVLDAKILEKSFLGEPVKALQVTVNNPKDIAAIREIVKEYPETLEKKETDINFVTRYIIDKKVSPLEAYEVEGSELSKDELKEKGWNWNVDSVIMAEKIHAAKFDFEPKILAFDIEASDFEIGKGEIVMISFADSSVRKVLTSKKFENPPKEVEFVRNEKELIEKFAEFIKEYRPDFLVGYFSDAFDLPYLRMRADENDVKLNIGLDGKGISFIKGAVPSSEIRGLVHIDLYKFINNIIAYTLQSETISLNDVAKELIGEEKVKIDIDKITKEIKSTKGRLKDGELRRFCLYNLQDSVLTAKLFEKLWPNIAELAKIVKEPLFEVNRATYSNLVEHNIIHNAERFNEIIERRPIHDEINERRQRPKYTGAFVKEPIPGIYDNIAVFDFRSFYPNIIVSFNISCPTLMEKKPLGLIRGEAPYYETPEFDFEGEKRKFYFKKKKGFFPQILADLLEKRKETKSELKKHRTPILEARDYALKTLSNATYGYLGFFGARYYSLECAASIAAIARHYIHKTIEDIEKAGFNVIYSDTDSIIFSFDNEKEALSLLKKINESLPGTMELELENFYKRGIFVLKRTGELGAKKKYALLSKDDKIKIRGFESVRRDRCRLAKDTQDVILKKVLEEGKPENALEYAQEIVKQLKDGKVPIGQLIIRTQLKKEIESYESIGPHVTVAKRMREQGLPTKEGSLIEFVIAKGNEKLIRDRARMPEEVREGEYDIDYYINNQVLPAIESIFAVFDIKIDELKGRQQKSLKDF
jgi:DNA polymerase elongation subunit (family B)